MCSRLQFLFRIKKQAFPTTKKIYKINSGDRFFLLLVK